MNLPKIFSADLPNEVIAAQAFFYYAKQDGFVTGIGIIDIHIATVNKYPKYFPKEHIYYNLPAEVHRAYREDRDEQMRQFYEEIEKQRPQELVSRPFTYSLTMEDILQDMEGISKIDCYLRHKKQKAKQLKDAIWDKHYKKYGL